MNHVKESSICIYEKTAIFKEKYFGLASEYSKSEIKVDILDTFFKRYVDNRQNDLPTEVSIKKEIIKAPVKTKAPVKVIAKTPVKSIKEKTVTKVSAKAPASSKEKTTVKAKTTSKK
jgi:hypothetical protein